MLYYVLDLLVGFGFAPMIYGLIRLKRLDRSYWYYFWIGAAIGLTWEIPIFVMSAEGVGIPIIEWIHPLPLPYPVFMFCHTLWDGGLFVIGVWLAYRFARPGWQSGWNFRAFLIMAGWGQLQALAVEISSTANGCWTYLPDYSWNPTLFHVNNLPITIMMQWVWLVASMFFYGAVLLIHRRDPSWPRQ